MKIYSTWRESPPGIGDAWLSIQFYLHLSESLGEKIFVHCAEAKLSILQAMVDSLESTGNVQLTTQPATEKLNPADVWDWWNLPYLPTKQRWTFQDYHRSIAVAFDGVSAADQKNLAPHEQEQVLRTLRQLLPKKQIITVGKELGLDRSIEVLCQSLLFVGVCSGMSHVAHSVGTPQFLYQGKLPLDQVRPSKAYTPFKLGDFEQKLKRYLGCLSLISHQDMR